MKYNFVIDKIRKVIYSCVSRDQLMMASTYSNLLLLRWKQSDRIKRGSTFGFESHFRWLEMISWKNALIKEHKLKV